MELTQEYLKSILEYNPESGEFTWIQKVAWFINIGDIAGSFNKSSGYNLIWVKYKSYKAHRLAWLYMTGSWPEFEIDHINHIRNDNRFENLRDTDKNMFNKSQYKNNSSGYKGVSWYKAGNKWRAQINVNGKKKGLGYFIDIEEASKAYQEAKLKYHQIEEDNDRL